MSVIADLTANTVRADLFINAPIEKVYRAFTDPQRLAKWWGSAEMYRTYDWQLDLRPGGKWRCQIDNAAQPGQYVGGEYRIVEPPRLLEYTWSPSWDNFATTLIRLELAPEGAGTRLRLTHSGFATAEACQSHTNGWTRVLGWMVEKGLAD